VLHVPFAAARVHLGGQVKSRDGALEPNSKVTDVFERVTHGLVVPATYDDSPVARAPPIKSPESAPSRKSLGNAAVESAEGEDEHHRHEKRRCMGAVGYTARPKLLSARAGGQEGTIYKGANLRNRRYERLFSRVGVLAARERAGGGNSDGILTRRRQPHDKFAATGDLLCPHRGPSTDAREQQAGARNITP
jgi:hypothetical protein